MVRTLMEKHGLHYDQIGRVDVGTGSPVDQSKCVKTFLMRLFGEHCRVEGCGQGAGPGESNKCPAAYPSALFTGHTPPTLSS